MIGIYASYDDKKHGDFSEAVTISNERGCVTWFDQARIDPGKVPCPAVIIIRIKGKEKYYRGTLLALARKGNLPPNFFEDQRERNHRPKGWKDGHAQTVLFIYGLCGVKKPIEVAHLPVPERPIYIGKPK